MKNEWTGGQYSLYRALFGLSLFAYFLHLIPWGKELFSNQGALGLASEQHHTSYFPNLLALWNNPFTITLFLSLGALLILFLVAGLKDRWAAVGLWYLWACLLDRNPLIMNPHLPYIGWILLAHACLPTAPAGSWDARKLKDGGRSWEFSPAIYGVAWLVVSWSYSYSGYHKLFTPAWQDGTALHWILQHPLSRDNFATHAILALPSSFLAGLSYFFVFLEFLYGPLSLFRRLRPWLWVAMLGVFLIDLFLLDFFELTWGMILVQLFLFDPGWIKRKKGNLVQKL